jgi:hypothetical protein
MENDTADHTAQPNEPEPGPEPSPASKRPHYLLRARDLLLLEEPLTWVIDHLLPAGVVTLLAGSPKIAKKTLLALRAAIAVARGEPFCGLTTYQRPAIYCFLEDGKKRAARRLRQLGLRRDERVSLEVLVTPDDLQDLLVRLTDIGKSILLVIDPLVVLERKWNVKDENVAQEIEKVFEKLRSFAQSTESSVLVIHHFRKAGDVMRGSGALEGSSDGWINVTLPSDRRGVELDCTLRDAEDFALGIEIRWEDDYVHFSPREVEERSRGGKKKSGPQTDIDGERIRQFLYSHAPKTFTQKEIAEGLAIKVATVKSKLANLEKTHLVHRPDGKKGGYAAVRFQPSDLGQE